MHVRWMKGTEVAMRETAASTALFFSEIPNESAASNTIVGKATKRKRDRKAEEKKKAQDLGTKRKLSFWSAKELKLYIEAVQLYGKDHIKIFEHVGTRSMTSIKVNAINLARRMRSNPNMEGAHILPILEGPCVRYKNDKH